MVFWQKQLSPHMAYLIESLTSKGIEAFCMVDCLVSGERTKQGWAAPCIESVTVSRITDLEQVGDLLARCGNDAVHVCQGVRGHRVSETVVTLASARGLRWGIVAESVDDRGGRGIIKRPLYARALHRFVPDFVLAIGRCTTEWFVRRGVAPAIVFPFAYFLSTRNEDEAPGGDCSSRKDDLLIGYVGTFSRRKRVDLLIDFFLESEDRSLRLLSMGDGSQFSRLSKRGRRLLSDGVWNHLGVVRQDAVRHLLEGVDIVVLPSDHDGWGASISEGLIAGSAVVASDACGVAEVVIASRAGEVFRAGNSAAFRQALERSVDDVRKGVVRRDHVREWARCLQAPAGADYLSAILAHVYGGARRPDPPWRRERLAENRRSDLAAPCR